MLPVADSRKLALTFGLLRNSTIFAAQKSGLEQCSQKAPEGARKLKLRPDWQRPLSPRLQSSSPIHRYFQCISLVPRYFSKLVCLGSALLPLLDCVRHGCRTQAPMDGFTACPAGVTRHFQGMMVGIGTSCFSSKL